MDIEQARFNMIEQQIRPWDVLDPAVLAVLARIRREDFVPAEHRALAFTDTEIPLPEGQCMLAPRVEARLLQELQLKREDQVLEIGAGSGFMAALMAHQAHSVLTLEIRPALARMAQSNLERARLNHVTVRQADGANLSTPELQNARFDAIVLSGSVALDPQALLGALKPGGRLVGIIGQLPVMQAVRITRLDDQAFERTVLFDTVAPRLDGFTEPSRFVF